MVYFSICAIYVILKRDYYQFLKENYSQKFEGHSLHVNSSDHSLNSSHANESDLKCILDTPEFNAISDSCSCIYLYPPKDDKNKYVRSTFEIVLLLYTIMFLLIKLVQMFNQKLNIYIDMLIENTTKFIFLLSLICILLMVPMRISCIPEGEDYLMVISIILMSMYFLYFAR